SKYHINKYLSKRPIGVPKNLYLHIGMKLIFGHKNIQGIHAYKEVNKTQNLATMNTLTHAIKPTRSLILIDSTSNSINTNTINATSEFSLDDIQKISYFLIVIFRKYVIA
ncbi:3048_t:CDS:2, partial [Entrophospora sp. SA101]